MADIEVPRAGPVRTAALTAAAMVAFAANSLLCRLALAEREIDPASFSSIRVVSGALTLALIFLWRRRRAPPAKADGRAVLSLFVYLVFFGFAYVSLGAGTGALILFGSVQLTMFGFALAGGERLSALAWAGLGVAVAGLVYLVSPGLSAPDPRGAALMAIAGAAWGVYSLTGRTTADALAGTTGNFLYATPLMLAAALLLPVETHAAPAGVGLAIASGALASGCGYVIWYAALQGLTPARAAMVQLSVPVIAAVGAVLLLAEPATWRLAAASAATLGGVGLALTQRSRRRLAPAS